MFSLMNHILIRSGLINIQEREHCLGDLIRKKYCQFAVASLLISYFQTCYDDRDYRALQYLLSSSSSRSPAISLGFTILGEIFAYVAVFYSNH